MEDRIIHIRRTIDIELAVPQTATDDDIDELMRNRFVPDGIISGYDGTCRIYNVRLAGDDDQDCFIVVSWPESQELCEYEGYPENCTFITGEDIPGSSYLVNKDWYSRIQSGEIRKSGAFKITEY